MPTQLFVCSYGTLQVFMNNDHQITHLDQNFKDQKTIIYVRFNTPNVLESNIAIKTLQHELVGQYVYWYSMPETVHSLYK